MQLDETTIKDIMAPILDLPWMLKMTHELAAPGLIFISHSSADKPFVESVIRKIPKSHLFYDIDTINPGSHTVDALDDGLLKCSVFAMFVSKNTQASCWVDYETGVAEVEKIKKRQIKVIAIPIDGASYKDAPEWMQRYMAVPPGYSASDIARLLKYLYEDALRAQGILNLPPFVGREDLCNKIILQSRTKPAETGLPLNFVILAGIQSMGRFSVAKNVIPKIFPGARNDLPVFDLPRHADAVDLFIALRQDITGKTEPVWAEEQIRAFPSDPQDQAVTILGSLSHFAKINQTVIIKSAFGLRDQSRTLKPWLERLFILLRKEIDVRVVWISERLLPPESIDAHQNVIQFQISELLEEQIVFLLTELLSVSDSSPAALKRIAPHVHGHPGSAHYVANLVRTAQRGPESLLDRPDAIRMFQERCVEGILNEDVIGSLGNNIVTLLKIMPWADYELISAVFCDYDGREIADILWFMTDNCIINYNMTNGYKLAEIVRGVANNSSEELSPEILEKLANVLSDRLKSKDTNISALEAIIFVKVRMGGALPEELRNILTGATLLDLVEQYYRAGHRFDADYKKNFKTAADLSLLAADLPIMSIDTLETILFNGADSLIRIGDDPTSIISKMEAKKLPAVAYLMGSYHYHQRHDRDTAIEWLEQALKAKSFVKRTARLLAKIYMENGQPIQSLDVFKRIGDHRVHRDTGLLAQKVRCLRAVGEHAAANELVLALSALDDETGEYDVLTAARLMKEGKFDLALAAIESAKAKPKANRVNLRLLETAIKIEKGDFSSLEDTCKLAVAVGLEAGAHSLRARASIRSGHWSKAESELAAIGALNYYDKLLLLRALDLKKADMEVLADPALYKNVVNQFNNLLVEMRRHGEGDWFNYG